MPVKENLVNQKFNKLLVIEPCENIKGRTAWLCQCDCGNVVKVWSKSLKSGNTKSCGCLQKEITSKRMSKDISNKQFGNLLALSPTDERRHGSIVWKCQCSCGNIHYATTEHLMAGSVQSCGCIHSRGNAKIKNILQNNNYEFIAEYPIRLNNVNYYFDFAILKNNNLVCFIEYDGILHFEQDANHGWNNEDSWLKTQQRDKIKNNYCIDNNIPLIRIPY